MSAAADALAACAAAPLSRKAAMRAVLAIDAEIDRRASGADLLAARAALAAAHPALALVMALADMRAGGPQFVLAQIGLPPAAYAGLGEADYMVALYNGATVPRVLVAMPDGTRHDALALLRDAVAALPAR